MNYKTIRQIIPAQKVDMGGHLLDQPLPAQGVENLDPFLLIHHWHNHLPGRQRPQEVGVGPHPHRGFSPVTFIFKGAVEHRDSFNNRATVEAGGTQWMFAGRGITHSERFPKKLVKTGGDLEFIQFWVNVPAEHKMKQAFYKPISKQETPLVETENSKVWVVAGEYNGVKGIAPTYTPQTLLRGELQKDAQLEIDIPASFNTLIYVLEGGIKSDDKTILTKDMAIFNQDADTIQLTATANARFILLSGEPINEPIAQYGPFVMNDQTQVMEAIRDAQIGKMGILIEEFD